MTQRPYNVILYGASGFVGKQTVAYFAKHPDCLQLHWAVSEAAPKANAGRNQAKLEKVRQDVGIDVDIIPAEANDSEAINSMVSQTKVLLNTAGPFALYRSFITIGSLLIGRRFKALS